MLAYFYVRCSNHDPKVLSYFSNRPLKNCHESTLPKGLILKVPECIQIKSLQDRQSSVTGKFLISCKRGTLPGAGILAAVVPTGAKKSIEQIQCLKPISIIKTIQKIYYHLEIKRKSVTKTVLLILAQV
jgi:hypothetical protein